ncbi:MAG TPA: O-antigen ligase family protein [Candidatus Magasanikbacteria bacterium]|nr:O-antigen ligase family protein [Candidatus Magasanikbacteria bacterium]
MLILALIYFVLFLILAFKKFDWAVYFLILTLPTYIIRLQIGPLPTTILEISFFAVVMAGLLKINIENIRGFKNEIINHKAFLVFLVSLLIFSFVGALTSMIGSENPTQKLVYGVGEWRALFLEPILLFILLVIHREKLKVDHIILSLFGGAVVVSTIALVQKFTGSWFPPSLWDDHLFGRVTSIFTSANAIGLFTVPILFLSLVVLQKKYYLWLGGLVILLANAFSISQGAWIAIGAGVLVYLYILGYRKITVAITVVGIVGSLLLPSMREAVLFQDQAGKNRLTLWTHTVNYLTDSPQNFILGSGVRNFFDAIQKPFYNPKALEALKYPHNIILNFWTEIGLFGMISFVGIIVFLFIILCKVTDTQKKAAYIAALTALIIHGLVDVPYFKNDLAMLFWIIAYVVLIHKKTKNTTKTSLV